MGPATAALIRPGTGSDAVARKPAEGRNGWSPNGYPKKT